MIEKHAASLPSNAIPDHPHTRGENLGWWRANKTNCGPSPHAWGEPSVKRVVCRYGRTIPTRVGRTPTPAGSFQHG